MSEQIKKYQHIIMLVGGLIAVASAVYNGVYSQVQTNIRVDILQEQQIEIKSDLQTRPTKTEFEMMKDSVNRIDKNVQNLNDVLLRKK